MLLISKPVLNGFVRKSIQAYPGNTNNIEPNEFQNKNIKTTDVNILLNRVRLNRKKIFKKRILVSLIFLLLSSFFAYVII